MFFKIVTVVSILLLHTAERGARSSGNSLPVSESKRWPILDCFRKKIDLILIADASAQYKNQIQFYDRLQDAFFLSDENDLNRIKVTLLDIPFNLQVRNRTLNVKVEQDSISSRNEWKDFFSKENRSSKDLHLAATGTNILKDAILKHKNVITLREGAVQAFVATADSKSVNHWCQTSSFKFICQILSHEVYLFVFDFIGHELNQNVSKNIENMSTVRLDSKQAIQMFSNLCQPCPDGWFVRNFPSGRTSSTTFSCYQIGNSSSKINWMDASALCGNHNDSELVTLESKEEQAFLSSKIKVQQYTSHNNISVCIGLRREEHTLGRRFRWINQMPLVHTSWGRRHPKNGPSFKCAVWTFIESEVTRKSVQLAHDSYSTQRNYWESTGCGSSSWTVYICEINYWSLKQGQGLAKYIFEPIKPNIASINNALNKGQLIMLDNAYTALTSVPTSSNLSLAMPNNSQKNIDASIIPLLNCQNQGNILYNLMCGSHFRWFRCDEMRLCQLGCDVDEFRCKSGKCIGKEHKCDLYKDCEDGDDEQDCFKCQHALCSDGRCLPKHWLGDGEVDCDTCTDDDIELEMKASGDEDITKCVFLCNKTKCVYEAMLHDGVLDCRGPEGPLDETLGALASTVCYQKEYPSLNYSNWAPKCVYIKDDFEELIGCRNMKHLEDCQNFECPEGYVKCPEAYCIPLHYVNNNKYDCPNGEDESTSIALECPGYFMCDNNQRQKMCLHPDFVCDGKEQCPEGEDEINCNVQCLTGLLCVSGAVVVIDPSAEVDLNLIDVRTRYIDISETNAPNVFSVQPAHSFNNLIEARFARCNIVSLNFSSLFSVLYKLDLSGNYIESIENQSVLTHMPVLRYLNLSRNTLLSVIQANAFNNNKIEELDLSYTNIRDVTFTRPLCELKKFFLVNTPIALRSLTSSLYEKSLHELDLRGVKDDNVWPDMFKHIKICYSLRVDNFKFCCRQLHNVDTSLKACTATPDPFSSCSDLMDSTILRIFLWTTGMFSILGNAVVIFYRFVYDRKAFGMGYGHFVLNLGLSDFLMGVYLIIVASADMHYRGSYLWGEQGWRSSVTCKASGFLSTLSNETSIFFIFLITLDRFLVIRFPFGQVKIRSRVAIAICVVTWSVGIALALIPGLHYFGHWSVYTTTGVCVGLPLNPLADTAWLYSQSIFIYVNFLLFLLITAGQVVIYKTMSKMRVEKECLTNVGKRRLQDITVAKNLLLVVVTNFLCWFPIGLLGVMTLCGYQMDKDVYAWTAVLVLPINSAINPILYTVPSIVQNYQKSNEQTTRPSSQTTSV